MRARLFNTWPKRLISFTVVALISLMWLPVVIIASHKAAQHGMTYGIDCYMDPGIFAGASKQICQSHRWDITQVLFYMQFSIGLVCTGFALSIALIWIMGRIGKQTPAPAQLPKPSPPPIPTYAPRPLEETHG